MALLGPVGLETLSTRILSSTRMTIDELSSVEGLELAFPKSPVFREFAVKVPGKASEALSHIFELGGRLLRLVLIVEADRQESPQGRQELVRLTGH